MKNGALTTVFADAACIDNGRPHACGAFRLIFKECDSRNKIKVILPGIRVTTNNRVHLHALLEALRICPGPLCVQTCSKITVRVHAPKLFIPFFFIHDYY